MSVFWITGLSGAGKSTVGKLLYNKIKKKYVDTIYLDGDELRAVFGKLENFELDSRRQLTFIYATKIANSISNNNEQDDIN